MKRYKIFLVLNMNWKVPKQIILAKLSPPLDNYIPRGNLKYPLNLILVVT